MERHKVCFYLDKRLLERMRNTVYWRSGPPDHLTVSQICVHGLELAVEELERKYNHGKPFKKATGKIRAGRPIEY